MLTVHPCVPLLTSMACTEIYDIVDYLNLSETSKTQGKRIARLAHTTFLSVYISIQVIAQTSLSAFFNLAAFSASILSLLLNVAIWRAYQNEPLENLQKTQEILSFVYSCALSIISAQLYPNIGTKILFTGQIFIIASLVLLQKKMSFSNDKDPPNPSCSRLSIIINHGTLIAILPTLMNHAFAFVIIALNIAVQLKKNFQKKTIQI